MTWIIILFILFIIIKFITALKRDQNELQSQPLEQKFSVLIKNLNDEIYDGKGEITVLDNRSFNLFEDGAHEIIQFFYSTSNLNLTWRSKTFQDELICTKDYPNVRNISDEIQLKIGKLFLNDIAREIKTHETLNNIRYKKNAISSSSENDKFIISSLFYSFCFSKNIAEIFLVDDDEKKKLVSITLTTAIVEDEKILELFFKKFLTFNNIAINNISSQNYQYNSYVFFMDEFKIHFDEHGKYFEVLQNNIESVKNAEDMDLAVANYLILFVQEYNPHSLYVIVKDPYISRLPIREVFLDGSSTAIAFVEDFENAIKFLTSHVQK